VKESDIRPKEIFEEYLRLSQIDSQKLDPSQFVKINCPSCSSDNLQDRFSKNNYTYQLCKECGSLFCNPRPTLELLDGFYQNSISSDYWAKVFAPSVAEVRREKLFKTKSKSIFELLEAKGFVPSNVCDAGAGYGVFLEELGKFYPNSKLHAIEPSPDLADLCTKKGFETLQSDVENASKWNGKFDFMISSEVIEHVFSPKLFVSSLYSLLQPSGYCLITGLGYEGFDILTLEEKSNSIFPPHHLNFLSVHGFELLFQDCGFKNVEVITPGLLDFDIVLNSNLGGEFVRVLKSRGEEAIAEFQKFLQKFKLSSHVWILAQK
jgi:SAM-dependent methyltransferase